jgi:hypothetical protein
VASGTTNCYYLLYTPRHFAATIFFAPDSNLPGVAESPRPTDGCRRPGNVASDSVNGTRLAANRVISAQGSYAQAPWHTEQTIRWRGTNPPPPAIVLFPAADTSACELDAPRRKG